MSQNSTNNKVGSSTNTANLLIEKSASGLMTDMFDQTDRFGYYNNAGSPEGVVAADIGSVCTDTANGTLYIKQTDTVNTGWVILAPGPSTTAFSAVLSVTQNNVSGSGTLYPVVFDTELFDIGGNYNNATGIFTVPTDGIYLFTTHIMATQLAGTDSSNLRFTTTGTAVGLIGEMMDSGVTESASNQLGQQLVHLVQCSAGDTINVVYQVGGAGGDTISVNSINSIFSGFKIGVPGGGGGGFTWQVDSSSPIGVSVDIGHISQTVPITYNLPATCAVGDEFAFVARDANGYIIQAGGGQTVQVGTLVTSGGGTVSSTAIGDTLILLCTVANTEFVAINRDGNYIIA